MTIIQPNVIHDAGRVAADGSRLAGCQKCEPTRDGAGDYLLTFQAGAGIDSTESALIGCPNTDNLMLAMIQSSDVAIDVKSDIHDGTATDCIWSWVALQLSF